MNINSAMRDECMNVMMCILYMLTKQAKQIDNKMEMTKQHQYNRILSQSRWKHHWRENKTTDRVGPFFNAQISLGVGKYFLGGEPPKFNPLISPSVERESM